MKLDTGLPGRPMKSASVLPSRRTAPNANGLPGLMATCHNSTRPSALTRGADVIFLAHRDAAGGDDQVVMLRRAAQRLARRVQTIGHDAEIAHVATCGLQQAAQRVAVRVVDRPRRQVLRRHAAGHDEFVAGGEQRDARPAHDLQRGRADRCGEALRLRRQARAARQHRRAHAHVFAAAADPLTWLRHGVDAHAVVAHNLALLLHHDRVGACGHLGAGKDARCRAGQQRRTDMPRRDALRQRQHGAGRRHVGSAYCIAVHRRVVLRRHVDQRDHVLRQHAAEGVEGGDGLNVGDARCVRAVDQTRQRIVERQQARHAFRCSA